MVDKIREGFNIRSGSLPMDEEAEAVIVTPYVLNPTTQIWEPMQPYAATALGTVRVQDGADANRLLAVDVNGRVGVVISTSPLAVIATDLDIRDLNTAQDLVLATIATAPLPVADSSLLTELQQKTEPGNQQVAVLDRPSQKPGRIRVRGFTTITSLGTGLHTVTLGKTLYVESVTLTFVNTSTTTAGDIRIQDGSTNVKFPFVSPNALTGSLSPSVSPPVNLPDPVPFTSDFRIVIVGGSLFYSCFFEGYEE